MSADFEKLADVRLQVNGEAVSLRVPNRRNLVDALRYDLGLKGSHVGCEHGICGACSVVVNGEVVRGCLMLAAQAEGAEVETIEGATASGRLAELQDAFFRNASLQCGFCTVGMLLTAAELLERHCNPSREEIRAYLSGNYCRCTGYHAIVNAIEQVARQRLSRNEPS